MYSYEIDNIIKNKQNNIDSNTYSNICKHSPQINHIKYSSFTNSYEIWTEDGYYWNFTVYKL